MTDTYRQSILETPVTVLGNGSWGTALALALARNGQPVRMWGHDLKEVQQMETERANNIYLPGFPFPENLQLFHNLQDALFDVQDIIVVVPSHVFKEVILKMQPLLLPDARIAWGTKGVDAESSKLLHVIVEENLGAQRATAVIAGPSFAQEVAKGLPTALTIATTDEAFCKALNIRLANSYFRPYFSQDIIGVEVCGLVKNVLAIAAGVVDGLGLGANALSALITRGLAEMRRLGIAMGGKFSTFMGLAGLGDLVLTCSFDLSRNRRFGQALAQGKKRDEAIKSIGQVVEGLNNLNSVYLLAQQYKVEMPIIEQMYKIIHEDLPVPVAIQNLFAREPKSEEEIEGA